MSVYKTKEFKKLKDTWYKKLEKSGFVDVEASEDSLKEWDSSITLRYDKHIIASKEEYFRLAGKFLFSYEFESERDTAIWQLHSDGLSLREIATQLKKKKYKINSMSNVNLVVKKLAQKMIEKYGINTGKKRPNPN